MIEDQKACGRSASAFDKVWSVTNLNLTGFQNWHYILKPANSIIIDRKNTLPHMQGPIKCSCTWLQNAVEIQCNSEDY